jgi:hypothetical protein
MLSLLTLSVILEEAPIFRRYLAVSCSSNQLERDIAVRPSFQVKMKRRGGKSLTNSLQHPIPLVTIIVAERLVLLVLVLVLVAVTLTTHIYTHLYIYTIYLTLFTASSSAPCATRTLTTSSFPSSLASIRGVLPLKSFFTLISAPYSIIKILISSSCPQRHSQCIAVNPNYIYHIISIVIVILCSTVKLLLIRRFFY